MMPSALGNPGKLSNMDVFHNLSHSDLHHRSLELGHFEYKKGSFKLIVNPRFVYAFGMQSTNFLLTSFHCHRQV